MKKIIKSSIVTVLGAVFVLLVAGRVMAATAVDLNTAESFVVLAGTTVTNTGSTVLNGDLGLSPGSAVIGFPPGVVNGQQQVANPIAVQAQVDLTAAYTDAAGQTPVTTVPTELGGTTKTPGIYDSTAGTFTITGALTLDAQGDPDAVFIFKTASTLITAGASSINLVNGAQACNVFWQVGSSATLGTTSAFRGNILALTSATVTTGATVEGRVLTRNGAVTLDTNTITKPACTVGGASGGGSSSTDGGTTSSTPGLPNTGVDSQSSALWGFVALVGLAVTALTFYIVRKKSNNGVL